MYTQWELHNLGWSFSDSPRLFPPTAPVANLADPSHFDLLSMFRDELNTLCEIYSKLVTRLASFDLC